MLRDDEREGLLALVSAAKDGSEDTFKALMDYCNVLNDIYYVELMSADADDNEKYELAQYNFDEFGEIYQTASDYSGFSTPDEWEYAIQRRLSC